MPRLPTSLLRKARAINPLLPPLLGPCRNLESARSELRWLGEFVDGIVKARHTRGGRLAKNGYPRRQAYRSAGDRGHTGRIGSRQSVKIEGVRKGAGKSKDAHTIASRRSGDEGLAKGELLRQLVQRRAKGCPLQYILGTEYFGELEIECKPGVLIPRCVMCVLKKAVQQGLKRT